MNLASIHRVYCVGLGGVGVSAVAKYFLAHGAAVAGSDPLSSPLIDDVVNGGAKHWPQPDPARLTTDLDLVVFSDACPPDHPELLAAERLGLPRQNFAQTLGLIMGAYAQRVAVCGTNGKSTTTALTGLLLLDAGFDPSIFVGSRASQFDGNLRLGRGSTIVVEADEYRDHFHHLSPTILTITNVELDHVDYFSNLHRVIDSFRTMIRLVPPSGSVIINADDPVSRREFFDHDPRVVSFGFDPAADLRIHQLVASTGQQEFFLTWRGEYLDQFTLRLPGRFNVYNAAAAIATAILAGAKPTTFGRTIADFRGVWRRFEIVSPSEPVTVVNDYAHHPTAVKGTLKGAGRFFPGRRVVAVFQPHHYNRLTNLFDEFVAAFDAADEIIVAEVYSVLGRDQGGRPKTSRDLVAALTRRGRPATYVPDAAAAASELRRRVRGGDVVIVMGAGDIWTIAKPLAGFYAHHQPA